MRGDRAALCAAAPALGHAGGGFAPMENANLSFNVNFDDDLEGSMTNSHKGSNLSDDEFDVGGFGPSDGAGGAGRAQNPTPPLFDSRAKDWTTAPPLPGPGAAAMATPGARARGAMGSASGSFGRRAAHLPWSPPLPRSAF